MFLQIPHLLVLSFLLLVVLHAFYRLHMETYEIQTNPMFQPVEVIHTHVPIQNIQAQFSFDEANMKMMRDYDVIKENFMIRACHDLGKELLKSGLLKVEERKMPFSYEFSGYMRPEIGQPTQITITASVVDANIVNKS